MTHEEASELLAVCALDAVDDDERVLLETHLGTCPRCRAELDAHREVAAALGNSVEPLPEGLWSSIASRLPPRPDEEPPPMPVLAGERAGEGAGERAGERYAPGARFRVPRPAASPRPFPGRGRFISLASIAAAVAAAAVAAVLGVHLVRDDHQISNLRQSDADAAVTAALHTRGHEVVTAESPAHAELAKFVVLPSGQGYLVQADLPPLSSKETYQLWGIIDGRPISLGLLGRSPHSGAFTLAGTPAPSRLGITVEPAGGSVAPTGAMVASATV